MMACLSPVCSKTVGLQGGKNKVGHEVSKRGKSGVIMCQVLSSAAVMVQKLVIDQKLYGLTLSKFSWRANQLKQMASRIAGGSLTKYCKPGCGTGGHRDLHDEGFPSIHPAPGNMHAPQFSMKTYGRASPRRDANGDSEIQFDQVQVSPKALKLQKNSPEAGHGTEDNPAWESKCDGHPNLEAMANRIPGKEWVAEIKPGVFVTFCTGADGLNDLKRIKFSRAMFSKEEAESWWAANCPKIRVVYKVRPPSLTATDLRPQLTATDDDTEQKQIFNGKFVIQKLSSGDATPDSNGKGPCAPSYDGGDYQLTRRRSSADARLKDSDSDTGGPNCNSWIEQDETGVYLTIILVPGVGKQLKRVRFSRDQFSEGEAAAWWEHNRQRIYAQYIFTTTKLQNK